MIDYTILLINEGEDIYKVLRMSLGNTGYKFVFAENMENGFGLFSKNKPHVVIADIKMSDTKDVEFIGMMKKQAPDVEFLIIIEHGDVQSALADLKNTASNFLIKPVNTELLIIAIKRAVELVRLRENLKFYNDNEIMCDVLINQMIHEEVIKIAPNYRIQDINNAMLNKLGIKREDAIGKFCYEITHHRNIPCSGDEHPCPLVESIANRKSSQSTHIHLDKESNEIYCLISCYPLIENEKVTGVIELSRDVTRDVNMQKSMLQQDKLASIGRLAAGVAHEINNPLTTILTTAMLIQEDLEKDNPIYQELDIVSSETLRCRKIVTSLLNFARQSKPEKKQYDICEIMEECALLTRKQAAFKNITINFTCVDSIPKLFFDKGQIEQAVINLILNATDAVDPGGSITLSVSFNPKKDQVIIKVGDTGKGIPFDLIDKIFDPFFSTKDDGTGLGLSITSGIIEQHGGAIDVSSKPGYGTTFTIVLPAGLKDK
ncbi:MAG: response regulator [Proteobacteria bacterium]|nr:response regulator [Pseudomonadota bacterium]MBU4036805.1 response regulator [Pseudomonadota bacterium]